jgi:hypothetical protein
MLYLLRLVLAVCLIFSSVPTSYALVSSVADEDGTPNTFPWQLRFTDGTVTDNGDGTTSANVLNTSSVFDALADVDMTTVTPSLNKVAKWDGSNWVPGEAGDTTEFTFSIDSFSDGISDTSQLIGAGDWLAIGAISFTATYSNAPGGMTATVALSGASSAWAGDLSMTPVTGPETNTEAVTYPSTTGGTITFTLAQSQDASTDTETVTFNNTMRYGNSALTEGNQTEASIEALSEVAGPNESRSQTISNIATTANQLVFSYADRLSDIQQVRITDGGGYVTAAFNATATTVIPAAQTGITNVANSAAYSETFAAITSKLTGLADGANDFTLLTSSTAQNYLYTGKTTTTSGYTEADVEGLTNKNATNDNTRSDWPTVTQGAGEYYLIGFPDRLTTPTFKDEDTGFEFALEAPETVAVTNYGGFQENYNVWRSENANLGAVNLLTE